MKNLTHAKYVETHFLQAINSQFSQMDLLGGVGEFRSFNIAVRQEVYLKSLVAHLASLLWTASTVFIAWSRWGTKLRRKDNRLILLYKGLQGKTRITTGDLAYPQDYALQKSTFLGTILILNC